MFRFLLITCAHNRFLSTAVQDTSSNCLCCKPTDGGWIQLKQIVVSLKLTNILACPGIKPFSANIRVIRCKLNFTCEPTKLLSEHRRSDTGDDYVWRLLLREILLEVFLSTLDRRFDFCLKTYQSVSKLLYWAVSVILYFNQFYIYTGRSNFHNGVILLPPFRLTRGAF